MAKGKSSASSATRKKHALRQVKKNAGPEGLEPPEEHPKQKQKKEKGGKGSKKEVKPKIYIPPVKPAPVRPDPLETTGLAYQLPAELLISLRSLSKKAVETKVKGLEELQNLWVDKVLKGDIPENEHVLVDILPVWLHHLPSLFIHPSRRVRLSTATLHGAFLQVPAVREQIVFSLTESLDEDQVASIVGAWCIAVHDIDRVVSNATVGPWQKFVDTLPTDKSSDIIQSLQSFAQRAALDPNGTYMYLNPPAPAAPQPPPTKKGGVTTPRFRSETPDVEGRTKADAFEEIEADRIARIRVGALGSLRWLLDNQSSTTSFSFFNHPALWTSLHHSEHCTFGNSVSFGFGQPNVRKSGWMLLQSLLKALKDAKDVEETLLPTLSTPVLRSAWVESDTAVQQTMWQPLLTFLKEYPPCWKLEQGAEEDEGEGEDEDEDGQLEKEPIKQPRSSHAYREFLQFLQLGCGGSPLQGYPAVVIILSTIPSEVLVSSGPDAHSLDDFFVAFWAAVDGRALSSLRRTIASAQFLSALLECVVFLVRRSWRDRDTIQTDKSSLFPGTTTSAELEQSIRNLVNGQLQRTWSELAGGSLKMDVKVASERICKTLEDLNSVGSGLFESAWQALSAGIRESTTNAPLLVCSAFSVFLQSTVDDIREAARHVLYDIVNDALDGYQSITAEQQTEATAFVELLTCALQSLGEVLITNSALFKRVDNLVVQNSYTLLASSQQVSKLLFTYLTSPIVPETQRQSCWRSVLMEVSTRTDTLLNNLSRLLAALEETKRLDSLRPVDELDSGVAKLLVDGLGSAESTIIGVLKRILRHPEPLVSDGARHGLFQSLTSSFGLQLENALQDQNVSVISFNIVVDLIAVMLQHEHDLASIVASDMFLFCSLLPYTRDPDSRDLPVVTTSRKIWKEWETQNANHEVHDIVIGQTKERLRSLLADVTSLVLPEHIIIASKTLTLNPLEDVLPSPDTLNDILVKLPSDPIHQSLAVLEPLIPPPSMFLSQTMPTPSFDPRGHSLYTRYITTLIALAAEDRQIVKRNMWILKHLLTFSVYAEDLINFPSGTSSVFSREAIDHDLSGLVLKVHQVETFLLSISDNETSVALNVLNGRASAEGAGPLSRFIVDLVKASQKTETIREFRVLCRVLQHVFDDVERDEADNWVVFARTIEKTAPNTSIAILTYINAFGSEPPRLERYRNELAASLLGLPASKADTEGLMTLRKLSAVAPPAESDTVFLPSQRAVNVIKTYQQWVTSEDDDDVDEEVECAMTLVITFLAPLLQHVTGNHWAFIFDVVENNLENSSLTEDHTLTTLARTLRLIVLIQDLSATNKALRAEWEQRESSVLTSVRELASSQLGSALTSAPASSCRELVLSIVHNLPQDLVDHGILSKMCYLLTDSSLAVQKMAYELLRRAAHKRSEYLVIEAGVDTEDTFKAELPQELLVVLQQQIHSLEINLGEEDQDQNAFGYLLGWMLLFDLFTDTSVKVRSGYLEQLRSLEIVSTLFIPTIFAILGLDRGASKAFKLGMWEVEEFSVSHYEPGDSFALPVLAAHLYYRSLLTVPSIVHNWVLDCKDVQLSSSIGVYTSTYFSPAIIDAELNNVKNATDLTGDENLSVKVASAVNEVTAVYSVDEHQLEIKIHIPSDWPLHRIEIRDVKRVGVDEKRWRAWILAVQQTMWAQNGRIADGLALFKKNVALHFEGQVECAICYSIISVMDASLPNKRCRTCKNRFHAGCLYKWFNTSHSSSCPLCRSDILH